MTAQFQFFQSLPHKKADFVKKSRQNLGYSVFFSFLKYLSRRVRKNGSSKKGISFIEQRSANDELYITPMYFQRGRKEVSVERICDKNRVTEGDVYRTGEREDTHSNMNHL